VADQFKSYSEYVNNYHSAQITLRACQNKQPQFRNFINQVSRLPICNHQDLGGFLITPIQRLPRYAMLLEALIKNTWEEHPDFQNLTSALQKVETINKFLNESKREHEQLQALMAKVGNVVGDLQSVIVPKRVWVSKSAGQIKMKHALLKKTSNGFVTVFNDAVMVTSYTEKGGEKLQFIALSSEVECAKLAEELDLKFPKGRISFLFGKQEEFTKFQLAK